MKYVENKEASHLTGFAFVVISIIHLAGGKLAEGTYIVLSSVGSFVCFLKQHNMYNFKHYTMFLMCLYKTQDFKIILRTNALLLDWLWKMDILKVFTFLL